MSEKYKQKDWLKEKYHNKNMSQREMSDLCDCSRKTISRWMNKLNVDSRNQSSSSMIAQSSCSNKHRDKNWLKNMYINEENSLKEVAETCGCSGETVRTWLNKHNIERRDSSERVNTNCDRKHKNKNWLEETYKETNSLYKTADVCGCTASTINKWMKKFNIERTGNSSNCSKKHTNKSWLQEKFVEDRLPVKEIAKCCGCSNTVILKFVEKFELSREDIRRSCNGYHTDKIWLEEKYNSLNMSEISDICGCSQSVVSYWMDKYDIITESGKFKCGENHRYYKDGKYIKNKLDFRKTNRWKSFSKKIKDNSEWKCEYCSNSGTLHTHHIEPVFMGGNKWDNKFIVLCKECHIGNYKKWHPPQLEEYIA